MNTKTRLRRTSVSVAYVLMKAVPKILTVYKATLKSINTETSKQPQ